MKEIQRQQTMTSLEIAELTGKSHAHLMRDIRNMEPAWEKVRESKFGLSSRTYEMPNGGKKVVPCYVLTKTECLYIATKFNDEVQTRSWLVWTERGREFIHRVVASLAPAQLTITVSTKQ